MHTIHIFNLSKLGLQSDNVYYYILDWLIIRTCFVLPIYLQEFQYNVFVRYHYICIIIYVVNLLLLCFYFLWTLGDVCIQSFRNWITVAKCAVNRSEVFSARQPTTTRFQRPGRVQHILYIPIYMLYYIPESKTKIKYQPSSFKLFNLSAFAITSVWHPDIFPTRPFGTL